MLVTQHDKVFKILLGVVNIICSKQFLITNKKNYAKLNRFGPRKKLHHVIEYKIKKKFTRQQQQHVNRSFQSHQGCLYQSLEDRDPFSLSIYGKQQTSRLLKKQLFCNPCLVSALTILPDDSSLRQQSEKPLRAAKCSGNMPWTPLLNEKEPILQLDRQEHLTVYACGINYNILGFSKKVYNEFLPTSMSTVSAYTKPKLLCSVVKKRMRMWIPTWLYQLH